MTFFFAWVCLSNAAHELLITTDGTQCLLGLALWSLAVVQASLNARTSILAAANPLGGQYDKSKPIKYNVALPPAILSR